MSRAIREARAMLNPRERGATTVSGRTDYTARNRELLDAGVHPATRATLRPDLGTCGDCAHHLVAHHSKRYHKCELHRLGASHSEASDIRVGWPACEFFKAEASE